MLVSTAADLFLLSFSALTFVFSPFPVAGSLIVNACQEMEFINGHLLRLDAEFVVELPLRCALGTFDGVGEVGTSFAGNA